ncbi:cyclodeaminase [Altererythrobacter sp.]|uniref:cyclodeaminase n=1 Tax=Altererythrobacter sp. TaxID=1872480 RepID=UPI003D0F0BEE
MPKIKILSEKVLRDLVGLELQAVSCIEVAFKTLASGNVVMPPILSLPVEEQNGDVCIKTAYIPGLESFAIKISPGFFNNSAKGLPSTTGLMVVHSSTTGFVEALLLDNGYLTDIRTAAAGAVAARHLSNEGSTSACIVGAGVQARMQLEALLLVRPITRATIHGRTLEKAIVAAEEMSERLGIEVSASDDLEAGVSQADIVITTTPSKAPLIKPEWLRKGQLVIAMGSDQKSKVELEAECIRRADLFVVDRLSQSQAQGELRHAIEEGIVREDEIFPELGEIVAGRVLGRHAQEDIVICDLTGTGIQDTAIANLACELAEKKNVGEIIET